MAKTFARGGAERMDEFDGTDWQKAYVIAGEDGEVVGQALLDTSNRTVVVKAGQMQPIIWSSIASAPAGSIMIW